MRVCCKYFSEAQDVAVVQAPVIQNPKRIHSCCSASKRAKDLDAVERKVLAD